MMVKEPKASKAKKRKLNLFRLGWHEGSHSVLTKNHSASAVGGGDPEYVSGYVAGWQAKLDAEAKTIARLKISDAELQRWVLR